MTDTTTETLTARELGIRSRAAVHARDRDGDTSTKHAG